MDRGHATKTGPILSLDQARGCGWAYAESSNHLVQAGYWRAPKSGDPFDTSAHLAAQFERTAKLAGWTPPALVTLEDVHWVRYTQRTNNPAVWLAKLLGSLRGEFLSRGFPVGVVNVQRVRSLLGLPSNVAFADWAGTFQEIPWATFPPAIRPDVATAVAHLKAVQLAGNAAPEYLFTHQPGGKP